MALAWAALGASNVRLTLFTRPKNEKPVQLIGDGFYQAVYSNREFNLPLPGAQAFAWETLGLVEFSPIGPSVVPDRSIRPTENGVFAGLAITVAGIPMQAGQIVGQPLFDPSAPGSGYTGLAPMSYNEFGANAPNSPYINPP